ncbi:MAG: hypothetical protein ACRBDI_02805 [Alphaproteobacteria bacterium]
MTKKAKNEKDTVLGRDVNHALRELVRLSKKLIEFADQEMQALIKSDHITFAFTQRDKDSFARAYAKASEEFRSRLDEFRNADKGLLMQLDALQTQLREKTASNNEMIGQIKKRASANTQSTLFTAQELGQRVKFDEKTTEQKRA